MRRIIAAALFALFSLPAAAAEPPDGFFCDTGGATVCAALPHDIPGFFATAVYRFMTPGTQDQFDLFSWQSFVALNWPVDAAGQPLADAVGTRPDAPRRWQYMTPPATKPAPPECAAAPPGGPVVTAAFRQATGEVLIDRDLNYVVYDTRVNAAAGRPVAAHAAGHVPVAFPDGHYGDPAARAGGAPGAVIVKTAWRVVDPAAAGRFLTVPGRIAVAAADSVDGRARCHAVTLGLVGMHIMRKVRSGNGDDWIWSTFEHLDNAPVAANARNANNIFPGDPFPDGCHAPSEATTPWSFFTADCPDCRTNTDTVADPRWAADPPFARHAVAGGFGSQVVRCWRIFDGTAALNRAWRAELSGTVLANYQLMGTQWRGNRGGPSAGVGEVPRYLTNTALETFVQTDLSGSCMSCHAAARTAAGERADFTFLLAE